MERERERERERNMNMSEKHGPGASHTCPNRGSNPQPRYILWLVIEPANLQCTGLYSSNWAPWAGHIISLLLSPSLFLKKWKCKERWQNITLFYMVSTCVLNVFCVLKRIYHKKKSNRTMEKLIFICCQKNVNHGNAVQTCIVIINK